MAAVTAWNGFPILSAWRGFGLACVINYLRWCAAGMPQKFESVSPRMLYHFARRYDEYEGEDYAGSSCRGALKGWHHNGVCLESKWSYAAGENALPQAGWDGDAVERTLGVYYRIDPQAITDLQAAILEVGAASATSGNWWDEATACRHSIVLGSNGRVERFDPLDGVTRTLQHQACVMPDDWFRRNPQERKRLVIYAHGGLNSEGDAIRRARVMGRYFLGNGCYPLFLVWKSGLLEALGDILAEKTRTGAALALPVDDLVGF